MTRDVGRPNDVHVRIGRLVVDRGALANASPRSLHESVAGRIARQLESTHARDHEGVPRTDLSDVIATAVAAHVSPRVNLARRR